MAESTLDKLSNLKFNSRAIQVETASDSLLGDSAYRGRGQGRGGRRRGGGGGRGLRFTKFKGLGG